MLALAALGSAAGFLAGLLGVGGALVMIPFLTFLLHHLSLSTDLSVKMAIATGMSTIVVTSIASARTHHKAGSVRWDLFKGLAPGLVAGSLLSSLWLFAVLKGSTLALVFSVFCAFSATQIWRDRKPKASRQMPGTLGQAAVGMVIGLFAGLVGAGGAFISVPFMTWCNVPLRQAVGTSAALGFPIALTNALGYVVTGWLATDTPPHSLGFVWLPGFLTISICTVITAPMGARLAQRMPLARLKRSYAVLLYLLAFTMLYKSLSDFHLLGG